MDRNDLLRMLDLKGKETNADEDDQGLSITSTEPTTPTVPASPSALKLDAWGLRRGEEFLAETEKLRALELNAHEAADFFASAFEPSPMLETVCVDPRRREFLAQLLETPDYHALHTTTMLNAAASEIAACAFAEQFATLKQEEKARSGKDSGDHEMDTLRAVGKALAKATEEVGEANEAVASLGMGPGSPGSNDPKAIASLFRRVRANWTLKRICELAGRFRRVAMSKQRLKAAHGQDDMVGVTLDGDLARLLPSELARLAVPEFELDMLRRIVERQAMCREYRGVEPVAKGPVIVAVDESGSMEGEKVHTAKALALALAWIARHQKRWIALVAYSGSSGERLLALPPGRWNEVALMDWLEGFIGKGSSLDVPVQEMPEYYLRLNAPPGKTDVVFITDASVMCLMT
jgi:uncharacterized protein with von Willebrand factor type A (vWA) domain